MVKRSILSSEQARRIRWAHFESFKASGENERILSIMFQDALDARLDQALALCDGDTVQGELQREVLLELAAILHSTPPRN